MSNEFAPPPLPGEPSGAPQAPAGSPSRADALPPAAAQPASAPRPSRHPRRGNRKRRGSADAGVAPWVRWSLIVGASAIVLGLAWSLALMVADTQAAPADPDATGEMPAMRVVEGMCLKTVGDDGTVADPTVVDCAEPHRGEVIATFAIPLEVYPGHDDVVERALEICGDRIGRTGDNDWVAWVPSEDSWVRGDRTVACIATSEEDVRDSVVPGDGITGEDA